MDAVKSFLSRPIHSRLLCAKRLMVHLFTEGISVHFACIVKHTEPDSMQRGNGSGICNTRTRKLKANAAYFLKIVKSPAENRHHS
jgi:hypothetical protein